MDLESEKVGVHLATWARGPLSRPAAPGPDTGPLAFQELFSKQKGYLDEELDYRKQCLDQAHKVREVQLPEPPGAADLG